MMEISGVSTSSNTNSLLSPVARAEIRSTAQSESHDEARHHRGHRGNAHSGQALGAFRQELRSALKAQFHARFAATQQAYAAIRDGTSDDVADEALVAAKQLVAESPTTAAKSLISFRATVHETAAYIRETIGVHEDDDDIERAIAKVSEGLNVLEDEVASNRESSATVLAVDTSSKQSSTIKIRTQEGDVVKLTLRRVDSLAATDIAVSDGDTFTTSTEVEVSSRSRMMLKVEGDLNESELAAIQNVFAQAERIADDFFGGDIGAAFNLAQGFEFDTGQLARVSMHFKMRQDTNVSYAETARPLQLAPATAPAVAAPVPETQPVSEVPIIAPAEVKMVDDPATTEPAKPAFLDTSALSSFFDALSAFLRSVGEGFEAGFGSGAVSFHYSESFKLELLRAVIHTVAPEDLGDSAATATSLIDGITEAEMVETS